jgi:hypothetical protein
LWWAQQVPAAITASLVEIVLRARKRHDAMNNTGDLPSIATLKNIALPERPDGLCNCNAAVAASFTACCTPSSQPAAPPGPLLRPTPTRWNQFWKPQRLKYFHETSSRKRDRKKHVFPF